MFFLLLAVLFLSFQFFNFRESSNWELQKIQIPLKKKIHLNQILFFNDIYKNYDTFLPKDSLPKAKYSNTLSNLSVHRGNNKTENGFFIIRGKEIAFSLWNITELMHSERMDFLNIKIFFTGNAAINIFAVPETDGIVDRIKTSFTESILNKIPEGKLIQETSFKVRKKIFSKTFKIPLKKLLGSIEKPTAGILFKIKSDKKKKIKIKIKNIILYNQKSQMIDETYKLDYNKYGGLERKRLKSVFIPTGSMLTYKLLIKHEMGLSFPKKIYLDGYLGSSDGSKVSIKISLNDKQFVFKTKSDQKDVLFFKSEIKPDRKTLNLKISIEGKPGNICILGNMSIYKQYNTKKNVVLYLIDALRSDMGGVHEEVFKKHFNNGAIFTSAYSNATRTVDSLPTIFSGKYKLSLIGKDTSDQVYVSEKEKLLAEYFKSKGYITAAFINNPWLDRSNASQGFDIVNHCWNPTDGKSPIYPDIEHYTNVKYGDLEENLDKFVQQNKNKPVFIYIHTMEPHVPYEPPLEMRKYSLNADWTVLKKLYENTYPIPCYNRLNNPDARHLNTLKSLYKDDVLNAYKFFVKLNKYLQTVSILNKDSLLILTADHGERFYEHKSWTHGPPDIYNEVVRIPMMIKGQGINSGIYENNVQLADIYPTIITWFGDKPDKKMVGNSLISYMKKKTKDFINRWIYIDGTSDYPHYALIRGKTKIIIKKKEIEVYDLENDPNEKINIQAKPGFKDLINDAVLFRSRINKTKKTTKKRIKMSKEERQRLMTLGYLK